MPVPGCTKSIHKVVNDYPGQNCAAEMAVDEDMEQEKGGKMHKIDVSAPPGLAGGGWRGGESAPSNAMPTLTLADIMAQLQKNSREEERRHKEMRGDVTKIDREVREVKTTASKALTQTAELNDKVQDLSERVTKLEGGGSSNGSWEAVGDPWARFNSAHKAFSEGGGAPLRVQPGLFGVVSRAMPRLLIPC